MEIHRRNFLKGTLLTAAGLASPGLLAAPGAAANPPPARKESGPGIIDTNVCLFEWPYRRLKYGDNTPALVAKLRQHGITQAWAGSYEALFHKNVNAVNARLTEECRTQGRGFLLPFGTVNPAWPDWEDDLRRCHEVHKMPGVRIFPLYQHIRLGTPEFARFIEAAGRRGMIVQVVGDMEDNRVHHPSLTVVDLDVEGLLAALKSSPGTRVQLVHATNQITGVKRTKVVNESTAVFDISRFEGDGILAQVLGVEQPLGTLREGRVPLERLLFGSHAPYFPVETSIMRLFESPLTLEQMEAMMEKNAQRFLGATRTG